MRIQCLCFEFQPEVRFYIAAAAACRCAVGWHTSLRAISKKFKWDMRYFLDFCDFRWPSLTVWAENWHTGYYWGRFTQIDFSVLFVLTRSPRGTDRRTGKTHNAGCSVADLQGASRLRPSFPFGRQTDAVTVLLISDNGTVLWATSISLMRSRHHVVICNFGHVS